MPRKEKTMSTAYKKMTSHGSITLDYDTEKEE